MSKAGFFIGKLTPQTKTETVAWLGDHAQMQG
jgi:hypothetical protein